MMNNPALDVIKGQNFSCAHVGTLTDLDHYQFFHPLGKGKGFPGKLFLKDLLGMTSMEVSLNKLPAGQGVPFFHQHKEHEEVYIFVKGAGQFLVDGTVIDVQEGSVIRVAPEAVRTWRNQSQQDLYYIVIQAKAASMHATATEDGVMRPDKVTWPA